MKRQRAMIRRASLQTRAALRMREGQFLLGVSLQGVSFHLDISLRAIHSDVWGEAVDLDLVDSDAEPPLTLTEFLTGSSWCMLLLLLLLSAAVKPRRRGKTNRPSIAAAIAIHGMLRGRGGGGGEMKLEMVRIEDALRWTLLGDDPNPDRAKIAFMGRSETL